MRWRWPDRAKASRSRSPLLTRTQFTATTLVLACSVLLQLAWMPTTFVAMSMTTIAIRYAQRLLRPAPVWAILRIALIVLFLWSTWSALSTLGQRAVFGGLLASMLSLKLLETERVRDARMIVAFGSFLAMTAFLFDQGPAQSGAALLFVVLAFTTLRLLVPGAATGPQPTLLKHTAGYAVRLVLLAVPFALATFVLFPRLDRPLWSGSDEARVGRTGMSNRLEPGQLSGLALDDTPAFRVTFDGELPPTGDRYFRGQVFWMFDGRGWFHEDGAQGTYDPARIEMLGPAVEYEVLMAPTNQRWLFLLDTPLAVDAPRSFIGRDAVAKSRLPVDQEIAFRARSATRWRQLDPLGENERRYALSLGFGRAREVGPQARALAAQWRARHGDDHAAIVSEALAIYNASFTYSLDPPLYLDDPIDQFLFEGRIGFCEHYASSFTYLMRAAGVPARVVGGYLGGYFNPQGGFLTVLNSDAHAWSEVWLAGRGWVRVDPTAAVAPERVERSAREWRGGAGAFNVGVGATLRDGFDVLGAWWSRVVVDFNAAAQRELFGRIGFPDISKRTLALLMIGVGAVVLALAAVLGLRARPKPRDPVVAAWRRVGDRLAKLGLARAPNEGPLDYAERVATALPEEAERMRALSRDFVRLRYASSGAADVAAFRRAASRFRPRATKQRRGSSLGQLDETSRS